MPQDVKNRIREWPVGVSREFIQVCYAAARRYIFARWAAFRELSSFWSTKTMVNILENIFQSHEFSFLK